MGRRPTLIITLLPYLLGWTLLGVSWFIKNVLAFKVVIMAGRFISGFGLGWAMLIGPVSIVQHIITSMISDSIVCNMVVLRSCAGVDSLDLYH